MSAPPLEILYEDNHCLAVFKSSGCITTHFQGKEETLDRAVKAYLKEKHRKPGNVFLGIVHRLDKPTSGVLLFARTSKAADRLARQFREGTIEKIYWAAVEGRVEPSEGRLVDFLRKDERHRKMHVTSQNTPDAQRAELTYRVLKAESADSVLEVQLLTGRKHQIRLQLAHAGIPILGDRKYGSSRPFGAGIALHSRLLVIEHPVSKMQLEIEAPLPASWQRLLKAGSG